jgi:hypothetical protein
LKQYFILLFVIKSLSAFSQADITLTGKVFYNKQPVTKCYVLLKTDETKLDSVLNNTTGRYEFKVERGHFYTLSVNQEGYYPKSIGPIPIDANQKLDYLAFNIDLEKPNEVYFTVQLFAGKKKVKIDYFKFNDITEREEDGFYRYTSGVFTSEKEAIERKNELINSGQSQAFIAAYKDGKRILIHEARKALKAK